MLAGLRRNPGPVVGTLVAAVLSATLMVAAFGVALAHTPSPLGRLAGADVVVAADPQLHLTIGTGEDAEHESVPLAAYPGVPVRLAGELARVPGVASATGETGFPGGTLRPGLVDLIAVKATPGTSPAALAQRIRADLHGGAGYDLATGSARGALANPGVAIEAANGHALGGAVIPMLITTALFALAATTALSVDLRRRRFALLRAVGATRGQIRRAILAEQALLAVAGGLLGFLPGTLAGAAGVRALAAHGLLPPGSTPSVSPWYAMLAAGIMLPVCLLSALASARRAARTSPAAAVLEAHADRARPNPVRILLGLVAAGGVVVLNVLSLHQHGPGAAIALALPLLMCGMAAVGLLGPVLVAIVAALARPLAVSPSARLALTTIRRMPKRTASAVIPVALAIGLIGAVAFSNTSIAHATTAQAAQQVTADHVLSARGGANGGASGGLLSEAILREARALPGVRAAVGVTPLSIGVADPDLEFLGGEAISAGATGATGAISDVLSLGVAAGQLHDLGPGQIAVSAMEASSGVLGVHLGEHVTVYLPDGTPYHAAISAIYQRSLALGDVLIPASVAAGHTGAPGGYSQILVAGGTQQELASLGRAHPGVMVANRAIYNAEVQQNAQQNDFGDTLILGVISVLAAVAMLNTLVIATLERRRQVRLLSRVGATVRQLAGVFRWQAVFVTVTGITSGAVVCAGTLIGLTRAVTGSPVPYIPAVPAGLIIAAVAGLALTAVMTSVAMMSGRQPFRGASPLR